MWDKLTHINAGITAVTGISVSGVFVWIWGMIKRRIEANHSMRSALVALLHHQIYEQCNQHLARGYISTDDLDDLGYLYRSYKALHGNGTGEALYNKVVALPYKNKEEN